MSKFWNTLGELLELFLAVLQFFLNIALVIICLPFIPIVWIIKEIKKKQ